MRQSAGELPHASFALHQAQGYATPIDPITRRGFLKGSIAAGTALMLSGPRAFAQRNLSSGRSIVIIGAGFAGLSAAYELL